MIARLSVDGQNLSTRDLTLREAESIERLTGVGAWNLDLISNVGHRLAVLACFWGRTMEPADVEAKLEKITVAETDALVVTRPDGTTLADQLAARETAITKALLAVDDAERHVAELEARAAMDQVDLDGYDETLPDSWEGGMPLGPTTGAPTIT